MEVEEGMKVAIRKLVEQRLYRKLSKEEELRVLKPRTLMGYEVIIDYISDENLSSRKLEEYLSRIT